MWIHCVEVLVSRHCKLLVFINSRNSLKRAVPATNLLKFGQICQFKKFKKFNHLGSVKSVRFCCLSLINKYPTVWLAPSSPTIAYLFRLIHEQAKHTDFTLPRWLNLFYVSVRLFVSCLGLYTRVTTLGCLTIIKNK